ncbi:4'-phosphopantetheinyl transferase superfamily protein [Capnocytophaga sp.]|uniref:4'-phosphopantetheinyl transferase family protein n=1 Tax=Capnocytophaga sp. TaxID=44737 RepID=UPI0026DAA7BD|nr:4'-phosphopantetheinyl transferase superfamily protein [Capnocytophaga sp.]MDO5106509.1 4'-phosphopantetheinyl transferase superfamily protein [Capnocytophaga sp.]
MPLFETINVDETTCLYVWKVTESLDFLEQEVSLEGVHQVKYDAIKTESDKKNFLATRCILKSLGYAGKDLFYDEKGKPFLKDGKHISISHSFNMVVVVVSEKPVGVDIEKKRKKIVDVAEKFTQWDYRDTSFSARNVLQKLTMIWSAKEAGFKAHGDPNITVSQVLVKDFFPNDTQTKIKIGETFYNVSFMNLDDFVLAYCQAS